MPNGIIIIDKPAGWTSMDVCAKLRGIFHERRVGHAGTLDPMATGILPVFIGRATRAVEYAGQGDKEYVAALRLGVVTNTQDTTGTVVETHPAGDISRERLEKALAGFRGEISQIPPMYSAVKVGGKKLYELARKGREVERAPRPVTIHALELLPEAPFGWPEEEDTWFLRVVCSKGTYIRTLCHDIGQTLGCGGAMSALRRTMACGFGAADAVSMEQADKAEDPTALLRPIDALFAHCPAVTVRGGNEKKVRNGLAFPLPGVQPGEYRVYGEDGTFLMLGRVDGGRLTTMKSFFEV